MEHSVRGSVWHKWDFHIHTPYSILNNQYGCNPYDEDGTSFDEYVKQLFTKAIEKEIAAIGITDYFSIDGYKRIRTRYLDDPAKMAALFPEQELREKIEKIYVFPNIEFRLGVFVGNDRPVNYHVIFSDEVSIPDIEEMFLQRLQILFHAGSPLPLTRNNIERVGNDYRQSNHCEGTDYKVGLERITVDQQDILIALKNELFSDKYIITIPVDEDLSRIDWNGRDYSTRKVLYQQCHCLLTSNPNTRNWALAKGHEEDQKREFNSIKPCIWGSDAHSYDRLFAPDGDRFCWIKAELSFAGLRQVLYEPEDRVRIQPYEPDTRNPHQTIDHLQFEDERFQDAPIYFSEWLTCIIGGKSTGKSILLRHIANSISPATVASRERKLKSSQDKLEAKASVVWKDGTSGERKIIYIPQSWLNQVVDETSSDAPINLLVGEILLQNDTINHAYAKLQTELEEITGRTRHNIIDYIDFLKKAVEYEDELKEEGRSQAFKSTIEQLEKQRSELTASAGITQDLVARYTELEEEIEAISETYSSTVKEQSSFDQLKQPSVYIPSLATIYTDDTIEYDLESFPTVKAKLSDFISKMNVALQDMWKREYGKMFSVYSALVAELESRRKTTADELAPIKAAVAINDRLMQVEESLRQEREKQNIAVDREAKKAEALSRAEEKKKLILQSRSELANAYNQFKKVVGSINSEGTELQFSAEIDTKTKELFDTINSLFDNRGFRAFKSTYKYDLLSLEDLKVDYALFEKIWDAMGDASKYGALLLKGGNTIQSALESLFKDWNFVHYIVQSGNDTINNMSPGKKALVLLEMLINLEKGNCPILIDQPEDDLDNRSIYSDLVHYMRQKKHERQIIVVTHNANVVVGADAEEIIIANQDGQGTKNKSFQFEYRSGAIENNDPVTENGMQVDGVLNQKGIQEQICDILEGGKQAFEARRNKYFSVDH